MRPPINRLRSRPLLTRFSNSLLLLSPIFALRFTLWRWTHFLISRSPLFTQSYRHRLLRIGDLLSAGTLKRPLAELVHRSFNSRHFHSPLSVQPPSSKLDSSTTASATPQLSA